MKMTITEGDPVRVTSGVYKDAEGIVEDLQPECSVLRIHTKAGIVYSMLDTVEKIHPPAPKPRGNILKR